MPGSVNVGGAWKTANAVSVNVGGAWKTVTSGFVNVAGTWKQWYSSAPPPAYELISTVLCDGSSAQVTFSSIPQDYKHLQIRFAVRTTNNNTVPRVVYMRYSGSVSSTTGHVMYGDTASVIAVNLGETYVARIPTATGVAGSHGVGIIDILDYTNTGKTSTFKSLYGHHRGSTSGSGEAARDLISLTSGSISPASSITSLSLTEASFNPFTNSTRFSLYGIKG